MKLSLTILASVLAGFLASPLSHAQDQVPENAAEIKLSFSPLVDAVAPAVVNIYAQKVVETNVRRSPLFDDPFFQQFFGDRFGALPQRRRLENSLGSGVVVTGPDGTGRYVITNHHVIEGATEIQVVLRDRREFSAEIMVSDERTDIAVLRLLNAQGTIPMAQLGQSDSLSVGDLVLAIGNPFGVGQTVTSGIVSGLARTSLNIGNYQSFIQTDAAINPGNSGGALVAMDGSVVGINTAIFSRGGGSDGIGFAVPADMARAILKSAVSGEPLVRPWLGFVGREVDWDIAAALGLDRPSGVLVETVRPQGPSARAGIQPGDIVLSIDGSDVSSLQEVRFKLATLGVDRSVGMTLLRDGRALEVAFSLEPPPEDPPRNPITITRDAPFAGASFMTLSPALVDEMGLIEERDGVMVYSIRRGSAANRIGLQPRDILVSVNRSPIRTTNDLRALMNKPPRRWAIVMERDGERFTLEFK